MVVFPLSGLKMVLYHFPAFIPGCRIPSFSSIFLIDTELPESIPTLSEWGMIIMSLMLAGTAIWMIRRRQTA